MSVPGNPRLVPLVGGELPANAPPPPAQVLEAGTTKLGDPVVAEVDVDESGVVTIVGVPESVVIDGGPVTRTVLIHGNRISLPQGDVVFQAEKLDDDGGRQGGEEPFTRGLADVDALDRN
jgi:hypothetical protein